MAVKRKRQYPLRIPMAAHGIRAQGLRSSMSSIWWAKRWIKSLEAMRLGARLGRGKQYAISGQVTSLSIRGPEVTAEVQGSRKDPYRVSLLFNSLSDEGYANVAKKLNANPMLAGRLFANDLPVEMEEIFKAEDTALFPAGKLPSKEGEKPRFDVTMSCNCPDWSRPCKHIVSIMLLLCEEIAARPSTLLALRGLDIDELYPLPETRESDGLVSGLPDVVDTSLEGRPDALAKRLGSVPFWRGERRFVDSLSSIFTRSAKTAKEALVPASIDLRYDYPSQTRRGE
jgi:uncharacterized Zn finger protein